LLLIRRGHEPGAGLWSLPGGRVEPGETDAEALVREMREETGLTVEAGPLVGSVRRPWPNGAVIEIRDYAATVTGGTLCPGDDAADARWVPAGELNTLPLTEGLAEILTAWGVLGQERQLSSRFCLLSLFCPPGDLTGSSRAFPPRLTARAAGRDDDWLRPLSAYRRSAAGATRRPVPLRPDGRLIRHVTSHQPQQAQPSRGPYDVDVPAT
jgi:ADP-ribose pyrophosphatase YjhB (NUDIX family)